jgi:hypothetical protein
MDHCGRLRWSWNRAGRSARSAAGSRPRKRPSTIGGLRTDQVCRLKELELEPGRLKQAVTELTLDQQILKGAGHCPAPEGNF